MLYLRAFSVSMLKISIKGLQSGTYPVEISSLAKNVTAISPEFFGDIIVRGNLKKSGSHYFFTGIAECQARMICDRSNEEFVELIHIDLSITFIANTTQFLLHQNDFEVEQLYYIRDDDNEVDLSEEVRQVFLLNLPMKRVAPKYRNVELAELYPEIEVDAESVNSSNTENLIDDRWSALKNITFDNKN